MPENLLERIQLSDDVDELPPGSKGVYLLFIRLEKGKIIRVGRLGEFDFPAGRYIYTGSAMGGLAGRIGRHLREEKKQRWHIDYLLCHAKIENIGTLDMKKISKTPCAGRLECDLNKAVMKIPRASIPVPRFGASDCGCPSHLAFFAGGLGLEILDRVFANK